MMMRGGKQMVCDQNATLLSSHCNSILIITIRYVFCLNGKFLSSKCVLFHVKGKKNMAKTQKVICVYQAESL